MINLRFPDDSPLKILCLGAHSDDIEIGCGGTLLRLLATSRIDEVKWVVFSGNEVRRTEALYSAGVFMHGTKHQIEILDFPDARFESKKDDIKSCFETLKSFEPNLIFTHYEHDKHQDHRLLSELTWNTFRDHLILEYEVPKYDGDLGQPACFVELDTEIADRKISIILESFQSQAEKHWFDSETFRALMRIRGLESAGLRYSEAFHVRKWKLC